jgi:sulfur-oxidizing protein SoxZ
MTIARIRMPARARRGETVEIRTLVQHPMETGFRHDNVGKPIPRHIIETFTCTYDGEEIFRARFHPAVAANPYLAFFTVAKESGELVFTWTDDHGSAIVERSRLEVEG